MSINFKRQSTLLHAAIIMDGNGRWAAGRGLPRLAGHREGVKSVRRIVESAPGVGIGTLTLFAFSSDNWTRPPEEVSGLMRMPEAAALATATVDGAPSVRMVLVKRFDERGLVFHTHAASRKGAEEGKKLLKGRL